MSLAPPSSKLFHTVDWDIHPRCEMFLTAKKSMPEVGQAFAYYFRSADFLIHNLLLYFDEIGIDVSSRSILDFASGYGRFTRYFVHLFREVSVADVENEMLVYNQERFGVKAYASPVDLRDGLLISRRFDIVFCFSLFTHLHPSIWNDWFNALFDLVEPGGLMIVSIRSPSLAEQLGAGTIEGPIDFQPKNETSGRLDAQIYGCSTVSDEYVRAAVARLPNGEIARRFDRNECDLYHDVYVIRRD